LWPSLAGFAAGTDVLDLFVVLPFTFVARWNIAPVSRQVASKKSTKSNVLFGFIEIGYRWV
jgi:hypothetical protein